MKKKLPYILIIILIIMQVVSANKIINLENKTQNLENELSRSYDTFTNRMNSFCSDVDEKLNEQASIIFSATTDFGEFDVSTHLIPITFSVVPKQVTDTMTVSLEFYDETILLEKEDTTYSVTKNFPLSDNKIFPKIIIEDNGTKNVTNDNGLRVYSLIDEFIPRLFPFSPFPTNIKSSSTSDIIEYTQCGDIFIDSDDYDDFKNIKYETYIDNNKVNSLDIDLNGFEDGRPVYPGEQTYELKSGQILTAFIVAQDKLGFTHQYLIEYYVAGNDDNFGEPIQNIVRITDKNGDIVYDSFNIDKIKEEYGINFTVDFPKIP